MNRVILAGRLASDTTLATTPTGINVVSFKLAVSRKGNKDIADFIDCVAFGSTAEFVVNYCVKGDTFVLEGRWETGSYVKKDGTKVYTDKCVVDSLEKVSYRKDRQEQDEREVQPREQPGNDIDIDLTEDDLPF